VVEEIMTIKAESLEQFASELHQRKLVPGDEPEPLPLLPRWKSR
jgi:hypothetical protein